MCLYRVGLDMYLHFGVGSSFQWDVTSSAAFLAAIHIKISKASEDLIISAKSVKIQANTNFL
jgi:hypothetical protein